MKAIDILIDLIKQYEGCRLKAYPDPGTGKEPWTIGWGHTGPDVTEGTTWSQQYADAMLRKDADRRIEQAFAASPLLRHASVERQAAIADFIYNCGVGNYMKSTLKKCVDRGDWEEAGHEIVKWTRANGRVLPGLVSRRESEEELLTG